jgi:hypothetical protein
VVHCPNASSVRDVDGGGPVSTAPCSLPACSARAPSAPAATSTTSISTRPDLLARRSQLRPDAGFDVPLGLIETRTFGSRVIYERYGRARDESG